MRIKKENIDNSQIKEEVTPTEEIKQDTDANTDVDITPVEEVVVEEEEHQGFVQKFLNLFQK